MTPNAMTLNGVLLALHILGAVLWVGGMFFALIVLRPSLAVLQPAERLALNTQVFRRFFLIVWHAMPITVLTGFAMVGLVYGGFAAVGWNVHLMVLTGLAMSAVFAAMFFAPWRDMRAAMAGRNPAQALAALSRIRMLVTINLVLGLITVVVAAL
jgi:uncharacterized membrane protein